MPVVVDDAARRRLAAVLERGGPTPRKRAERMRDLRERISSSRPTAIAASAFSTLWRPSTGSSIRPQRALAMHASKRGARAGLEVLRADRACSMP
jgi:hypothetical protein